MKLLYRASIAVFVLSMAHAQTTWTGAVDSDINNAANWDNGLPTSDGSNDGTVPAGFSALTGSPQNKTIVFEGDSGFSGNNFGGNQGNGYDVTFNGSGDADFTGNGLFLAWDGGAANDSSFTWNSTGTANTTRLFTSRFGMGTFTQSAGTINQNSTGNFDMIVGEFGAPQDAAGGTTWIMTGGTFNSLASEFEPRFGTMDMSGGVINGNIFKWNEGRNNVPPGGSTFVWNFSGGTINVTDVDGFNAGDAFDFPARSTGVLNVVNANYSIADAEADVNAGWITFAGTVRTPADFDISVVDIGGVDHTRIKLIVTTFTGAVDNDINNAANWDRGLPTKDGARDGIVPDGFPALTGNPRDKNITFEGNSGFSGNNFGGNQGNGYDVTFNGSGDADFTGNGLFLAWDGGAANDSSFTWNSTGTANTTRLFTSRFGMGTFTQSAGTINQNSTGNFDMIVGEFGAPQDAAGGTTWIMTGGTFNSLASEFEPRFGTMDMSGGVINGNIFKWNEGRNNVPPGGSTFVWNFSGGTINVTDVDGFNAGDAFNFTSGSTGILNVVNANYSVADAEADISAGRITLGGSVVTPADFTITVVNIGGVDTTRISLGLEEEAGPLLLAVSGDGTNLTFTWPSQVGEVYNLLSDDDMVPNDPAQWAPFQSGIAATPPLNTLVVPYPAEPRRFFAIENLGVPPTFADDFTVDGDWVAGNDGDPATSWTIGVPTVVGPPAAFSGVNCLGTNLASNYGALANCWVRSPVIDLTAPGITRATLEIQQFRDIEAGFHQGIIRVLDAGTDAQLGADVRNNIDGQSANWEPLSAALPSQALGKMIRIEFRFQSDTVAANFAGWYIDDVRGDGEVKAPDCFRAKRR